MAGSSAWANASAFLLMQLAFCAQAAAAAGPTSSTAPIQRVRASPSDLFVLAEEASRSGDAEQAEKILQLLSRDPEMRVRNEARFRLAVQRELGGRNRDAAVLLRRILDENPDASAVRIRLAMLLQKIGDVDAAHRELRAVRVTDLPPNVIRFVDRLAAATQARKRFGFQVELALAPDSNINRASRSDTVGTIFGDFALDEESQSGTGLAGRGLLHSRLALADRLTLVTRALGDARLYRKSSFNDIVAGISAGPELALGTTVFGVEAGLSQQWYGMKPYQRSMRLNGSIVASLDKVSQLRLDIGGRWVNDHLNDLSDGSGRTLVGRYERAISQQLAVVASGSIDRFKARDDAYSTWSWSAGLSAYQELGRMTLNAGVEIGALRSDDRLQLLLDKRDDRVRRLHVGAVFRQLTVSGFAPIARVVVERNRSSVEFYDYERIRTEVGISRSF